MGEVIPMKPNSTHRLPGEPRRVRPQPGRLLTRAVVSDDWWPSSCAGFLQMFSIVWSTPVGECWAPLHDFAPADQQRFLDAFRRYDELYAPYRLPPLSSQRLN